MLAAKGGAAASRGTAPGTERGPRVLDTRGLSEAVRGQKQRTLETGSTEETCHAKMLGPLTNALLAICAGAEVPPWPHTYNLAASTIIMPANGSGLWDYSKFSLARFGIVDWDQSVNLVRWARSQPWDASSTML